MADTYVEDLEKQGLLTWEPDDQWTTEPEVIEGRGCRRRGCGKRPAVAALLRSNGWWCYCADHLYGRRIENGVVLEWRRIQ